MITTGQSITNPVTGETLVFRKTSADTNGESVVVETYVEPNGAVAATHVHLERARRARGGLLAPDPVDQAVGRDDVVRVEQELREEGTRPRPAERERRTVVSDHLHRPEQPEFHALTPP